MNEQVERASSSPDGEAGPVPVPPPAASPAPVLSSPPVSLESGVEPSVEPAAGPEARDAEGWDAVAVTALVLVVTLLAVPAVAFGIWAAVRARGTRDRWRRALVILGVASAELVLGALLWAVYFAALAPLITLPSG